MTEITAPYSSRAVRLQSPKSKRARVSHAPSFTAIDCVVLGVDPGKRAGWALWHKDRLLDFGEVNGLHFASVAGVVDAAVQTAAALNVRCVLLLEKPPTHHKNRSFSSMLGSGETRASWRLAWLGAKQPDRRRVAVMPPVWRAAVLGKGWGTAKREIVRPHEQRIAQALARQHYAGAKGPGDIGEDCAPAICIGRFGTHAGAVRARLEPKPKKIKAA